MKRDIEIETKSIKNQFETNLKNSRERERVISRKVVFDFKKEEFFDFKRFFFSRNKNFSVLKSFGFTSAFTLIELLVVVAIIGILASVVLASLNSARTKAKVASIKSNLKNIGAQMEILYLDNNNYDGINSNTGTPGDPNTTCQGQISNMVSSIVNQGTVVRCLSINYSGWGENAQRWAVTALLSGTNTPLEAYSANETGVVKWDTQGVSTLGSFVTPDRTMTWDQANTACLLSGGRVPTVEELRTLRDAIIQAGTTPTSIGFLPGHYWSSTSVPTNPANAYRVHLGTSGISALDKSTNNGGYVRCLK